MSNKSCGTCIHEPKWERRDIIGETNAYLVAECLKDNEPLIKIEDQVYVEGGCDENGVCLLRECKNYESGVKYLIVCLRHMQKRDLGFLFWGPDHSGYTPCFDKAGRYTQEDVEKYFNNHGDDLPILEQKFSGMLKPYIFEKSTIRNIALNTPKNRKIIGVKKKRMSEGGSGESWYKTPEAFMKEFREKEKLVAEVELLIKPKKPGKLKRWKATV